MKQTAVEWYARQLARIGITEELIGHLTKEAKQMEKEQMLDFGEFIIDELEPMSQNREWVEGRYNYFKSE